MRWKYDFVLYFLAALPFLGLFFFFVERKALARMKLFLLERKYTIHSRPLTWLKLSLLCGGLAFLVLALARPQSRIGGIEKTVVSLDMIFALDISDSMLAEDIRPSRLAVAKKQVEAFLERLEGDEVGLVAFSGSAFLAAPLTQDYLLIQDFLKTLDPDAIGTPGTNLGAAIVRSMESLQRAQAQSGALILITDAEGHEGNAREAAQRLREAGYRLYVIGIGTEEGAPIPLRNRRGRFEAYKRDRAGNRVITKLETQKLKELADAADGKSYIASQGYQELDTILSDIESLERQIRKDKEKVFWEEEYQLFLLPAVLLFIAYLLIDLLALSFTQRKRRVKAITTIFLLAGFFAFSKNIYARDVYQSNESGKEAYQEKNYSTSLELFNQALDKLDKERENSTKAQTIQFNRGMAALRANRVDEAMSDLERATKGPDPEIRAKAFHNRALALKQLKKPKQARDEVINAIQELRKDPTNPVAEKSRALLNSFIEPLKKQKKQKRKQGGQGKPEEKKSSDQKKENSGGTGDRPKRFKSEQLSEDQAKRMLKQMREKDREKLKELLRNRSRGARPEKDW